jgi:hypothetical protein
MRVQVKAPVVMQFSPVFGQLIPFRFSLPCAHMPQPMFTVCEINDEDNNNNNSNRSGTLFHGMTASLYST